MKLMVIPVGRSLVFSGSQAQNISYPTDHRRKIFRTLPITGKKYFVLYLRWLEEGNFLVQILCGGSVIGHTTDPAPAPMGSKEPEKGKRYFGLYLLMGGLNPYDMESDIETATALAKTMELSNPALAKTFYTPLRQHSVLSGQSGERLRFHNSKTRAQASCRTP